MNALPQTHPIAAHPADPPDWGALAVATRDQRYWEALCAWPAAARWNAVKDGIDYGHAVRSLLWDKVGRAIRGMADAQAAAFETQWLGRETPPATTVPPPPPAAARWRGQVRRARVQWGRRWRGDPLLFCPFPYARHARIIAGLREQVPDLAIGIPAAYAAKWPGVVPLEVRQPEVDAGRRARARDLALAIHDGLAAQALTLGEVDRQRLQVELLEQQGVLAGATAMLDALRPTAVLLPADNHSPFIEYAMTARLHGIPTIMLQHGLDCERYTLDEAYASHIATWGPDRAQRYQRNSTHQPDALEIVGNPHYDAWPQLDTTGGDPSHWLWLTRPHRPEKCHVPSRRPDEGLRILDALLAALEAAPQAHLTIKAHPFDYESAYRDRLSARTAPRVDLVQDSVPNLLRACGVVITEDSTAGMDAMFAGRALVHAHFAESRPVMPFVEYGAALAGYNARQLGEVLAAPAGHSLQAGQTKFLDDFAGPRDAGATRRFAKFVQRIVNRR